LGGFGFHARGVHTHMTLMNGDKTWVR
jgi:hypothetical protein